MHSADRIVQRLIQNEDAAPLPGERTAVLLRIATAPFSNLRKSAAEWSAIGTDVVGAPHPSRAGETITPSTLLDACEVHVAKRVQEERWLPDTSPEDYVSDLHVAAGHPTARLSVGEKPPRNESGRTQRVAATFTQAAAPGLWFRKVNRVAGQTMFVVYDADRSWLVSGYTVPDATVHTLVKQWKRRRAI